MHTCIYTQKEGVRWDTGKVVVIDIPYIHTYTHMHAYIHTYTHTHTQKEGVRWDTGKVVVIDNFFSENERQELLDLVTAEGWDHRKGPPPVWKSHKTVCMYVCMYVCE